MKSLSICLRIQIKAIFEKFQKMATPQPFSQKEAVTGRKLEKYLSSMCAWLNLQKFRFAPWENTHPTFDQRIPTTC